MKYLFVFLLLVTALFSKVYYSKVAPYEIRNISSNVSGLVLSIDENMIGKVLSHKAYIVIDSELDTKELQYISQKIKVINETIVVNNNILKNYTMLLDKKHKNYEKIKGLKIKSIVEKDREFYDLINSQNQYLSTKKEINNLKIQIADLNLRKSVLKRSIEDKNLRAKGFILYSLAVRPGQVVGIATPLAKIADISKAKLTIYLDHEDLSGLENKSVYLDGIVTPYKISRLSTIADVKNISKYMAQIIIDAPKTFSKLVKIELK
ncbi:HlyD family secretion protein [Sulfurimonas sp. SAG-AH-194-I05]|nr:HlyD family efflux transporter periplasmic adaptor subunit [Sulfurimonas sp. SAG-AH-194-I05]MDF1874539.1 HlyD family secretion protein [Sulfurimonas sp. SAG-AH-194-I05]